MDQSNLIIVATIISAISTVLTTFFIFSDQRFVKSVDKLAEKVDSLSLNSAASTAGCTERHKNIDNALTDHENRLNQHERDISKLKTK